MTPYPYAARQTTFWKPVTDKLQLDPNEVALSVQDPTRSPYILNLRRGTALAYGPSGYLRYATNEAECIGLALEPALGPTSYRFADGGEHFIEYQARQGNISVRNLDRTLTYPRGAPIFIGVDGMLALAPAIGGDLPIGHVTSSADPASYNPVEIRLRRLTQ